jgi:hypothetical protein
MLLVGVLSGVVGIGDVQSVLLGVIEEWFEQHDPASALERNESKNVDRVCPAKPD